MKINKILTLAAQFEKQAAALDPNKLYSYVPVPVSVEMSQWVQQALKPVSKTPNEYTADTAELQAGWGPKSQQSLVKFQTAAGVKYPGYLDNETLELLKARTVKSPPK